MQGYFMLYVGIWEIYYIQKTIPHAYVFQLLFQSSRRSAIIIAIIITPLSHGSNYSYFIAATIAIPWQQSQQSHGINHSNNHSHPMGATMEATIAATIAIPWYQPQQQPQPSHGTNHSNPMATTIAATIATTTAIP